MLTLGLCVLNTVYSGDYQLMFILVFILDCYIIENVRDVLKYRGKN